jgi:hypothetical protein
VLRTLDLRRAHRRIGLRPYSSAPKLDRERLRRDGLKPRVQKLLCVQKLRRGLKLLPDRRTVQRIVRLCNSNLRTRDRRVRLRILNRT